MPASQHATSPERLTAHVCHLPGIALEYFRHGVGARRVVLIHGFEASARIWTGVQLALPEDEYTTIAINNRGAGNSQAPADDAAYSIESFAADAYALTQSIGWAKFSLVGHSMGGATVAQLAVEHPQCLETLVLLNPASPDGRPGTPAQIEERTAAFLAARRARLDRSPALASPLDGMDGPSCTDDWRTLLDHDMARTPEQRLRGSMRSMHHVRIGARLQALKVASLLACGDRDDVIPLANMLETWASLPNGAGLQVWHGLGHSPNLDHPLTVASTLRQFIDQYHPAGVAQYGQQ